MDDHPASHDTTPTSESSPNAACAPAAPGSLHVERGSCYVTFALDLGLSIDLDEAERRIVTGKHRPRLRHRRRAPQYFEFSPPPLSIGHEIPPFNLGPFSSAGWIEIMLYDFAAISLTYSIPLHGPLDRLLTLSEVLYDNETLLADARRRTEQLLATIAPAVTKPRISEIIEDYVIYQLETLAPSIPGPDALEEHGPRFAQILRAEREPLSSQEINEALAAEIRYGEQDLLVVDWNGALLLDNDAEDVRAVLTYANVELLEMRYVDDQLDEALDASYDTLSRQTWHQGMIPGRRAKDLHRIAELQVDAALLFEGVNNALKLLGDQYLARVYRSAAQRLHVDDWDASIIRKLSTLESVYEKITDYQAHIRMEVLEWIIIILIAVSILMPFIPGLPGY